MYPVIRDGTPARIAPVRRHRRTVVRWFQRTRVRRCSTNTARTASHGPLHTVRSAAAQSLLRLRAGGGLTGAAHHGRQLVPGLADAAAGVEPEQEDRPEQEEDDQ